MAISLASLQRAAVVKPPRILLYGVAGVGKTTFAASAPAPVFIQTEDGLGTIAATAFPLAKSYEEVEQALGALYTEDHEFRTLIIDSIDWLEPLIWQHTCRINNWKDLEAPGYGKGYIAALDVWRGYIEGLNALRDEKGMTIIQIAHSDVKRFDSPEHEPYDRYVIKLHAKASALVQEHSDVVAFANYRISTVKADIGFKKSVVRAVGGGDRLLYVSERPAFLAKNRYSMPDSIAFDWQAVANHMPFLAQQESAQ